MKKLGLVFDERLSHDRKKVFNRNMSVFKLGYGVDFFPIGFDEDGFIEYLDQNEYEVVMIPWHLYFNWKKAANHPQTRVVGYFADAVLQFEFQTVPNYPNFVLLDFYRFDLEEIEILLKLLTSQSENSELIETFGKTARYHYTEWFNSDRETSQCVDVAIENPLFTSGTYQDRISSIRFFITSLWMACFQEKNIIQNAEYCGKFMIAESRKRLMIQLNYTSTTQTSRDTIQDLWPNSNRKNILFKELALHSDFLRVLHFPQNRTLSVTGIFLPSQPGLVHPGEVRGFWVENRLS